MIVFKSLSHCAIVSAVSLLQQMGCAGFNASVNIVQLATSYAALYKFKKSQFQIAQCEWALKTIE